MNSEQVVVAQLKERTQLTYSLIGIVFPLALLQLLVRGICIPAHDRHPITHEPAMPPQLQPALDAIPDLRAWRQGEFFCG